jgi:hypothetical protein
VVITDSSQVGMGAVLAYKDEDGELRPIATFRSLYCDYETRYSIPKKECYAMVAACKRWQDILMHVKFTILTDHKALIYLLEPSNTMSRTLSIWLGELSGFNYRIQHIAGKDNHWADWLSRFASSAKKELHSSDTGATIADFMTDAVSDTIEEIKFATTVAKIKVEDTRIINSIASRTRYKSALQGNSHMRDDVSTDSENEPQQAIVTNQQQTHLSQSHIFSQNDKLPLSILKYGIPYIEPTPERQWELLDEAHSISHDSVQGMMQRLVDNGIYFPNMQGMALRVSNTCYSCASFNDIGKYKYLASQSPHITSPWQHIQLDLTGPKMTSKNNYNYILVIVDCFTGFSVFEPLKKKDVDEIVPKKKKTRP